MSKYILPDDFNIEFYKFLYDDIQNLSDNDVVNHYITYGINEGRIYKNILPDNFDIDLYRFYNPDISYFSDNELKKHYFLYGKDENRKYIFDINNDFNKNFDIDIYKYFNDDLHNFTEFDIRKHFILFRDIENRKYTINLPEDFDEDIYKLLNSDLENFSKSELKKHYFLNGIKENREYKINLPNDFDIDIYRYLNKKLQYLTENELKKHYILFGIKEKLDYKFILPNDFDVYAYEFLNDDLNYLSDFELKKHYFLHGIQENRPYKFNIPNDFDSHIYRFFNDDLKNMNENELKKHYMISGIIENRKYKFELPEDFDVNTYKIINIDLENLNDFQLKKHYMLLGINENRLYTINENEIKNNIEKYNIACLNNTSTNIDISNYKKSIQGEDSLELKLVGSCDTSSILIPMDLHACKLSKDPLKIERIQKEHIISKNYENTIISDPTKTSKYIKPSNSPKVTEEMTEHIIPQKDLVELENIKEKIILKNLSKKNINLNKNSIVSLDNDNLLDNNQSDLIEIKDRVIKNDNNINLLDYDFINDTINIEGVYQESTYPSSLLIPADLPASKLLHDLADFDKIESITKYNPIVPFNSIESSITSSFLTSVKNLENKENTCTQGDIINLQNVKK
jgi:hypothetical protein